jgi:hypothetical protein
MSNPQGPGKHGRKDAKAKAQQPHHAAASAPGRSDQHGQSARTQSDQGHMPHRPSHSSSQSHSHSSQTEDDE